MDIDKIISQRLNAMENDLKQSVELLLDIYSQKMLVEYLLEAAKETDRAG